MNDDDDSPGIMKVESRSQSEVCQLEYLSTPLLLDRGSPDFVDRFSNRASPRVSARLEFTRTLLGAGSPLPSRSSYVIKM